MGFFHFHLTPLESPTVEITVTSHQNKLSKPSFTGSKSLINIHISTKTNSIRVETSTYTYMVLDKTSQIYITRKVILLLSVVKMNFWAKRFLDC